MSLLMFLSPYSYWGAPKHTVFSEDQCQTYILMIKTFFPVQHLGEKTLQKALVHSRPQPLMSVKSSPKAVYQYLVCIWNRISEPEVFYVAWGWTHVHAPSPGTDEMMLTACWNPCGEAGLRVAQRPAKSQSTSHYREVQVFQKSLVWRDLLWTP